jgi:hypothetical protein
MGSYQCCGSALVSMRIRIRIRIQHFLSMRIRIQIQGFDDQKLAKIYSWNYFEKIAICFMLGHYKGRRSYRRSLHPSKEHFETWIFFTFVGHFGPPGTGSGSSWPKWMRIRSGTLEVINTLRYDVSCGANILSLVYLCRGSVNIYFGSGSADS